ncbi:hypothetical protein SOCEGT47_070930 [Sorangium cellulosum]|uniref:GYF domain-containing protein n=1 Tax=Sorangium cellulosum TaxID=56 RepID=A0A4P2QA55_SORCE|nr:DUF4339 domain-containing protein [Sorangium cellulosum]AUX26524.1 hypothetical protein SOCEGT47_070930 [Sorangium cellulosum]
MGPSTAYKVEGLCDDGVPAQRGAAGRTQELSSLCSAPTMPVSSHTSIVADEPPESKPWCIDHGDWLEAMSTVALWRALEMGELPPSTRVWREGLECWTPAGEVKALCWTVSQPPPRDEACVEEAQALSAASEGPESTGPLSFALTPGDLEAVAPRLDWSDPARAPEARADDCALGPLPMADAASRSAPPSPPLSLDIPASFPAIPSSAPDTLPSAGTRRSGAPKRMSGPARGAVGEAPRGRGPGVWSRLARRARASRSAAALAAGSAAFVLALGLSALSSLAPPAAPASATVLPTARLGSARGIAAAAAQADRPRAPALAAATPGAADLDRAGTGAALAVDAAPAPGTSPGPAAGAASTPAAGAASTPAAGAASAVDAEAAAQPRPRAESAPSPGAKPAPVSRGRERGQVRLRRGRSEADTGRGIRYPGRDFARTGAILRDSR